MKRSSKVSKEAKDEEDKDSCVNLSLYLENSEAATSDELLRAVARSLLKFKKKSFEPCFKKDSDFVEGRAPGFRVSFKHPSVKYPYALTMSRSVTPRKGLDFLMVHIYFNGIEDQLSSQWQFGLKQMERLIEELNPSVAFMNSSLAVSENSFSMPRSIDVSTSKMPSHLLPLTYLGPNRLTDEIRKKLSKLPAAQSMAFNSGWMIEIVESLEERPAKTFESALNKSFKGDVAYYGPQH
ncbi:hypothetical protein [Hyalangium versicolor]|uniref:hypothetical protein n=1 Tax=Hyalangium versicolor TaxID=2861190 RepID=UPI001CCD25D0|nr:hypothetical protein [Hyalangium versicolor]